MLAEAEVGQMVVSLGVRVPMRDGVELIADVYRPAGKGRWPVVLNRTPYDRQDAWRGQMVLIDPFWLARQGFVVVVQDTRGRGEAQGDYNLVYQEVNDGYDTVEWAAAQPWSTGVVGIYGSSYIGITTYQAVASQAPHLKAALAFVGTTKSLAHRLKSGIFEASFMTWYAYSVALGTVMRSDMDPAKKQDLIQRLSVGATDPRQMWGKLPLSGLDVISDKELAPFWPDWLWESGPPQPSHPRLLGDDPTLCKVPLLHLTGYRDFLAGHVFETASALAARADHRFIAGPWTHRGPYTGYSGCRELPGTSTPVGHLSWGPLVAAWFDIHLRDGTGDRYPSALPWLQGDPVRYYLEGDNRWESAPQWPPATTASKWYLTSGGNARSSLGDGRLLFPGQVAAEDRVDRMTADPRDPFPTCGGALGSPDQGQDGIQDQRLVDTRGDVLVYTSETLGEPVRIAGEQQLVLQFSTTAPDADICVTLVDVEPSGFAYNVSEGALRTRYRNGGLSDWLEAGECERITIVLHNTAHVFKSGHRIRVMIAGANYPRLSRNLHTKTIPELGTMDEAVAADHTVHHGPGFPSQLVLNLLEK